MAITSGIFNSVNGDRRYDAKWFAQYFATFIGNGVFPNPSTGLQVIANSNMTTSVKAGKGWINGYFIVNDGDYVLKHDNADGVLKRIDRVVMKLNHVKREIEVLIKKGTFASSPVAPSLQRDADAYELALADVLINNGATQITQANITDQRLNKTVCGIVHSTVDQVDTTTIFNQYQEWFKEITGSTATEIKAWQTQQKQEFDEWFATIQGILEGDVAANLAARIANLENGLSNHIADVSHVKWIETTGGTANALTATIDGLTSYKNGLGVSFPVKSNSTAAMSLNINGLGAIPIKKANGTPFSNGKANGVYTVRYRDGSFILQGESEVEVGKQIITPGTTNKAILQGVHDGTGYVEGSANLVPGNIKDGVNIFGVIGTTKGYPAYAYGDDIVAGITKLSQRGRANIWIPIKGAIMQFDGPVRVKFDLSRYSGYGSETVYGRLTRNDVLVGTERNTNSGSITEFSEDIVVKKNDVIKLEVKADALENAYAQNIYLLFAFAGSPLASTIIYS